MIATRHVVSTILTPDGEAWAGAEVLFQLIPGSYTGTEQFPPAIVKATTDEYGALSVVLWTNEIGEQSCVYRCTLPRGLNAPAETFDFTLPAGSTDIELSVLRLAGVTPYDPQYDSLITWMLDQWKGPWVDGAYARGDKVMHNGSSYIAVADIVAGQEPGVHASWGLINQGTPALPLSYLEDYGAAGGFIRSDGNAWVRVSGVPWADLTGYPATFTPSAHTHAWADIVSGLPATWAPSAHTHPASEVTAGAFAAGDFTFPAKVGIGFAGAPLSTLSVGGAGFATAAAYINVAGADVGLFAMGAAVGVQGQAGIGVQADGTGATGIGLYASGAGKAADLFGLVDVRGNVTAAAAVARNLYVHGTLIAAANNDVLRGAHIAPTFTPGAYTGVTCTGLEIGNVAGGATNYALKTGTGGVLFGGLVTGSAGFAGALNGTVGAGTPATGAFTTLSATSGVVNLGNTGTLKIYGVDRGGGDGTKYLTMFSEDVPGLMTNGQITINGALGDPIPGVIAGHTTYMLGINSDVGLEPSIVLKTSGAALKVYNGADLLISEIDASGYITAARFKTANNYMYQFSTTQMGLSGGLYVAGDVTVGNGVGDASLTFSGANVVACKFNATDQAVDAKIWAWQLGSAVGAGVYRLRVLNDTLTNGLNAIEFTRTGIASVATVIQGTFACAALTTNLGLQTAGANDSAGAGYRFVRVPNA